MIISDAEILAEEIEREIARREAREAGNRSWSS